MIEAIRNAMAIKRLKRAGIFVEMKVVDRGGMAQTRFMVRHHGVVSVMRRRTAVQLAKTMERMERKKELSALVWSE